MCRLFFHLLSSFQFPSGDKEYLTPAEFRRTVRRNFGIMNEEWVKKYFKAFDRNHRRANTKSKHTEQSQTANTMAKEQRSETKLLQSSAWHLRTKPSSPIALCFYSSAGMCLACLFVLAPVYGLELVS